MKYIWLVVVLNLTACGGGGSGGDEVQDDPIQPAVVAPEPAPPNYLQQSVNYYCSANNSGDGWIWTFSSDNQLRDSRNVVVGNWSWTTNNSLTVSPIGNSSVSVVDQTNGLGLFNVNDNQQWGACTIATAEQISNASQATEQPTVTQPSPEMEMAFYSVEPLEKKFSCSFDNLGFQSVDIRESDSLSMEVKISGDQIEIDPINSAMAKMAGEYNQIEDRWEADGSARLNALNVINTALVNFSDDRSSWWGAVSTTTGIDSNSSNCTSLLSFTGSKEGVVTTPDPTPFVDKNCSDFDTQREAQNFFVNNGTDDPHVLDLDNDGLACECIDGNWGWCPVSPVVTPTPNPTPFVDKNCSDFDTQREAQLFFESEGGPSQDPHRLDQDGNGVACESLP